MRLDLTPEEALLIIGALNVCSTLRNTLAPVTSDQLYVGKQESQLVTRVLGTVAGGGAPPGANRGYSKEYVGGPRQVTKPIFDGSFTLVLYWDEDDDDRVL